MAKRVRRRRGRTGEAPRPPQGDARPGRPRQDRRLAPGKGRVRDREAEDSDVGKGADHVGRQATDAVEHGQGGGAGARGVHPHVVGQSNYLLRKLFFGISLLKK